MKYLLLTLFLVGCAASKFESFPDDLRKYHYLKVREIKVNKILMTSVINQDEVPPTETPRTLCLGFTVLSLNPASFRYDGQAPMEECNELAGYSPRGWTELFNWVDDQTRHLDGKQCY